MSLTTRQKWWVIGVETAFSVALAAWVLVRLDRLFEPVALLVAAIIIVVGDLVTVLLMERFAPTRITIEPGEEAGRIGRAVTDFSGDGEGRIVLRGERWRARTRSPVPIVAGTKVRVVSRSGLLLHVEALD